MSPVVILHVFSDDKFFDKASFFFDSLKNVTNLYYYYDKDDCYRFKYIKNAQKIKIFSNYKEYVSYFSDPHVNVVYFHNLSPKRYSLFKYIGNHQKVVWWCWGFEIYSRLCLLPPLVNIELYKPLTIKEVKKYSRGLKALLRYMYYVIKFPYNKYIRNKVLRRIDYFSPVLPIEYSLMKNSTYFRAKPIMLGGPILGEDIAFTYTSFPQNILIGNSLTYTNNHLDIFSIVRDFHSVGQKYIIPINYGNAYNNDHDAFKKKADLPTDNTIWIDTFLPYEKYLLIFRTVTHAIFGHMRQQAMGNIDLCLRSSVKIYLYKDSVIYKQLIEWGYIVYTIENDLSEESLKTNLSKEIALYNYLLNRKLLDNQKLLSDAETAIGTL